jgi:tetrahydromethanopterin S-methyltransferase subunit F
MKYDLSPIDSMVEQVKGNSNFLRRVLFGRTVLIAAGIVSAAFLIAALAT